MSAGTWYLGSVLAYGYLMLTFGGNGSWRWQLASGAVLCAFFCGGPNVLDWTYPNELFPTHIRATAVGFATSISRIGAALGTYLLPWSLDHLGMGPTFLFAAVVTAVGFLICLWGAPETKGRNLESAATVAA
ncbi:MFS transporter [Nocardia sp. NPDC004151]|uniref:MFS transporter n=1 Tax=Nocardia sp. NPDC004151 TaxID=3364304 RepID=UPI0036A5A1D8